jgi:phage host-nuclease inhibitor protein Gam
MKKTNQPALKTLEEVNETLFKIAALELTIEKDENDLNVIILDLKRRYETPILEMRQKVEDFKSQLEEFGKTNKKQFADQRSRSLTYGRIGFRAGKNALKLINPKTWSWDRVKEKLQELFNVKYVSIKITINKTKILTDFEKKLITPEKLEAAGIKISRSERFFYEIDKEKIKLEEIK